MERSDELRPNDGSLASTGPCSTSIWCSFISPFTFRRLLSWSASAIDSRRCCSAQRSPLSTPVLRPTVPTVFATGEPILRSMNSAPDLNRDEYDLEVVYAETEPLMAEEMRGWEEVNRESKGSV